MIYFRVMNSVAQKNDVAQCPAPQLYEIKKKKCLGQNGKFQTAKLFHVIGSSL